MTSRFDNSVALVAEKTEILRTSGFTGNEDEDFRSCAVASGGGTRILAEFCQDLVPVLEVPVDHLPDADDSACRVEARHKIAMVAERRGEYREIQKDDAEHDKDRRQDEGRVPAGLRPNGTVPDADPRDEARRKKPVEGHMDDEVRGDEGPGLRRGGLERVPDHVAIDDDPERVDIIGRDSRDQDEEDEHRLDHIFHREHRQKRRAEEEDRDREPGERAGKFFKIRPGLHPEGGVGGGENEGCHEHAQLDARQAGTFH